MFFDILYFLENRARENFLPNLFLAPVVRVLFTTTPPVPAAPLPRRGMVSACLFYAIAIVSVLPQAFAYFRKVSSVGECFLLESDISIVSPAATQYQNLSPLPFPFWIAFNFLITRHG
jgi:hypothetical protein